MPLRPKQAAFVAAYTANGGNATQAAITAGYPERSAASVGYENLNKPDIRLALDAAQGRAAQQVERAITTIDRALGDAWDTADGLRAAARRVVEENGRDRMQAIAFLGKRHADFRDGPLIDNSQTLVLPPGTTLDDLDALALRLREG